jgi:hypothetical protein
MKSLIYWHPDIYTALIRLSYGAGFAQRYRTIRDLIEEGSSVADICCGDCMLEKYLTGRNISYSGFDFNKGFIRNARRKGSNAFVFDIFKDDIPVSDYVVMLGSLYQFVPRQNEIIQKLLSRARKSVIISEPVKNLANARFPLLHLIARSLSDPGDGVKPFKFSPETIAGVFEPYKNMIMKSYFTANNIDYIVVLKPQVDLLKEH